MSERSLFIRALEIDDPAQREALLIRECAGDADLRRRIDVLLSAHSAAGGILDKPPVEPLATDLFHPITERPGTQIGPYKLLEQIGEGGFGVVYMAEQQQPVRRKVALKVLKAGMDTKQVIARFEAERQALALMDHPNIARVLDAGATTNGRPYFVMELVKGIPITQFCDEAQLTTRERLELFVTVCQAAQHAHHKGIIHRDIKPSNVLVTLHDGTPVVKVIDFGVAKATGQQLTEKTLFTGFAQMIGTPLYMSPEQAALSGLDIDTRSDIYSLGVLLYELLTGTTPFDKQRLASAAFDEIRRIIREEEAVKPSTRISTLGATATSVSALRKTEPQKLSQLLRNELDWIVMKALEKDRTRRYETASAFAADVGRFLRDEQVEACPPSTLYRLKKFYRRNRTALTTGVAFFCSMLVLAIFSVILAFFARDQRDRARSATRQMEVARREAETQRDQAEKSRQQESQQRQLAEEREAEAKTARMAETEQRASAERERDEATKQRDRATALNTELQRQKEQQRRALYVSQLNLIPKAWESNNIDRVRELLNATRPQSGEQDLRGFEWHYWMRQVRSEQRVVQLPIDLGTDGDYRNVGPVYRPTGVVAAAFSADGRVVATVTAKSASATWKLNVWETETGKKVLEYELQRERVPQTDATASDPVAMSRQFQEPSIAFVDAQKVAVVLFASSISRARGPGPLTRDNQITIPAAARLKVLRLDAQEPLLTRDIELRASGADAFVFSQDGSRFSVQTDELFVQVCATETGEEVGRVAVPTRTGVTNRGVFLALSPNGNRLALKPGVSLAADGTPFGATITDLETAEKVETVPVRTESLAFGADGATLVSVLRDPDRANEVRLTQFDAGTGRELQHLAIPSREVRSASYRGSWREVHHLSTSGRQFALACPTASGVALLELWDKDSGTRMARYQGHAATPLALHVSDDRRLVSIHQDGAIFFWPMKTEAMSQTSRNLAEGINTSLNRLPPTTTVSADGRVTITSADGRWSVSNVRQLATGTARNAPDYLAFPVTGEPPFGREMRLLDNSGKLPERTLTIPQQTAFPRFSPSGDFLVAYGFDMQDDLSRAGQLLVWEVATGRLIVNHLAPAIEENPSPNLSGAKSQQRQPPERRRTLRVDTTPGFTRDGRLFAIGLPTGTMIDRVPELVLHIWDLNTGRELLPRTDGPRLTHLGGKKLEFGANPDVLLGLPRLSETSSSGIQIFLSGGRLVGGLSPPGLYIWNLSSGHQQLNDPDAIACLMNADASRIAALSPPSMKGDKPARVTVWETATGKELSQISIPGSRPLGGFFFSGDGRRVALASSGDVNIHDADTGKELFMLQGSGGPVRAVAFNADCSRVVTSSGAMVLPPSFASSAATTEERRTTVWDSSTGKELLTLEGTATGRIERIVVGGDDLKLSGNFLSTNTGTSWDATPLSALKEAEELVLWLASRDSEGRLPTKDQMVERLQSDPSITDAVRNLALDLAKKRRAPGMLTKQAAAILTSPSLPTEDYERALALLGEAAAEQPVKPEHAHLEGLAYLRLNKPSAAFEAALRVERIVIDQGREVLAEHLALLAMAKFQLGQRDAALEMLQKAQRSASYDEVSWRFLQAMAEKMLVIPRADANPNQWLGQRFMPRSGVRITDASGSSASNWPLPFLISRVDGDRLGFGKLYVERTDVVPLEEAPRYYAQVLQVTPNDSNTLGNRGVAWRCLGEPDKAIEDYTAAIRANPRAAWSYSNRGGVYADEKKDYAQALADYDQAIRLDPLVPEHHLNRGWSLRKLGRLDEAIESNDEAIRLKPEMGVAYIIKAETWSVKGNKPRMLADLEEGVLRDPNDPEVWSRRAELLATSPNEEHRDGRQALADATKACELSAWKVPGHLDTLAAAHAELGKFTEAIEWQEKAIKLSMKQHLAEYQARLQLYLEGKPYRELPGSENN